MPRSTRRLGPLAITAATLTVLSACSGDVNPVRDVLTSTGLASKPTEAQDFVKESRPASLDYMPVGVSATKRATVKKTPQELKQAEAELDALRASNEAKAAEARAAAATPPATAPRR